MTATLKTSLDRAKEFSRKRIRSENHYKQPEEAEDLIAVSQ
jgi:hypothetical protein